MTKPDNTAAIVARLRKSEITDVRRAAASKGMTLSAYLRHCAQVVGGHEWAELVARGKYERKGKQEVESDEIRIRNW